MHVWQGTAAVPIDVDATAVTIGVFDGVHRGHRMLLDRTVAVADAGGGLAMAVTFDPHPMSVLRPDRAPLQLTALSQRLDLLEAAGLGAVLVLEFTPELAAESAERFTSRVLADTLHAQHVVVGRNFRYGHRASGDVALLRELGRELGFDVTVVELSSLAGTSEPAADGVQDPIAVSSTAIRTMIAAGEVAAAAQALGRPHRVSGPVVEGDRRGRELGFPTANVEVPDRIAVPGDGVYAGRFRVASESAVWRPAAVSIGTNPTFDGEARRVEAFVLDAPDGYDVYGQLADIEFVERIRSMLRFESVAELVDQMTDDVASARVRLR